MVSLWIPWAVSSKKRQASRDNEAKFANQEKTAVEERRPASEEQKTATESNVEIITANLNKDANTLLSFTTPVWHEDENLCPRLRAGLTVTSKKSIDSFKKRLAPSLLLEPICELVQTILDECARMLIPPMQYVLGVRMRQARPASAFCIQI